ACAGIACRHSPSPDATFLQIRDDMRKGQLDSASHRVDTASDRYRADPQWAARFRIQKAHILVLRGSYTEALQLAAHPLPESLLRADVEVERKMVQGLAYKFLQQFDKADVALSEAEILAAQTHSTLLSDVAQSRGMFELDQKHYDKANAAFRNVLDIARRENQPFREVLALGSLG